MSQFLHHLGREWRFMLKQRYVQILLICTLVLSGFSVLSGLSEMVYLNKCAKRI